MLDMFLIVQGSRLRPHHQTRQEDFPANVRASFLNGKVESRQSLKTIRLFLCMQVMLGGWSFDNLSVCGHQSGGRSERDLLPRDQSNVTPVASAPLYSKSFLCVHRGVLFILHIDSFSYACWNLRNLSGEY